MAWAFSIELEMGALVSRNSRALIATANPWDQGKTKAQFYALSGLGSPTQNNLADHPRARQ
jgi:hypothetical protein